MNKHKFLNHLADGNFTSKITELDRLLADIQNAIGRYEQRRFQILEDVRTEWTDVEIQNAIKESEQ